MATVAVTPNARSVSGPKASRWPLQAACREIPTAVFYPVGNRPRLEEEQAKAVCDGCPVRRDCLAFAIEHGEPFGVWGGLNTEERRAVAIAPPR